MHVAAKHNVVTTICCLESEWLNVNVVSSMIGAL